MRYFLFLALIILAGCNSSKLPQKKLSQFNISNDVTAYNNGVLSIPLRNTLKAPVRYYLSSENHTLDSFFNNPYTLLPGRDTIVRVAAPEPRKIYWSIQLGDPGKEIMPVKLSLPFSTKKEYSILQAYNGNYSHNDNYSRYAIDIAMKTGDTVGAPDKGFVVGVIKDYKEGGNNYLLKNYANFITLYHPHSGLFTQYVHLDHKGSLVHVGDAVEQGQPIGISGNTGWTSGEHLHFNVLVPVDDQNALQSIPIEFLEGYKGETIKRGDIIKKHAI